MADAEDDGTEFGKTIGKLADAMLRLDPGALASLRRMDPDGPGELAFWDLATTLGLRTGGKGLLLVKLIALMVPKGEAASRRAFHNFKRPLGAALYQAGYSEPRLARFLALPFERRASGVETMVRFLASKGVEDAVNCAEIASLLFFDDVRHPRRLARFYYQSANPPEAENFATQNKDTAS